MGDKSQIEWTDATWNPVTGCSKVSNGCKYCYAERVFQRAYPGRKFTDVRCHNERLDKPLRWKEPRRIFVNSMSDLFHEDVPFKFIADVFAVMSVTTRHTYQILTKRPQRMLNWFKWAEETDMGMGPECLDPTKIWQPWEPMRGHRGGYDNCGPAWPCENVWLGVSVEDQATADERIPLLLQIPAAIRFLSCEPLLEQINLKNYLTVLPEDEDGVAFFFKQWGEWVSVSKIEGTGNYFTFPGHRTVRRVGKMLAGRSLDGETWSQYPERGSQ